jgi:hypothetical protein
VARIERIELHDVNWACCNVTFTLRATVLPTAATVFSVNECAEEYAPMYTESPPPYALPTNELTLTMQLENKLRRSNILTNDTSRGSKAEERPK